MAIRQSIVGNFKTLYVFQVCLYLSLSSIIIGVRSQTIPWWVTGYTLLIIHFLLKLFQVFDIIVYEFFKFTNFKFIQLTNLGHALKEEMERVLIMISQFAFIHGDTNLLSLAILRQGDQIFNEMTFLSLFWKSSLLEIKAIYSNFHHSFMIFLIFKLNSINFAKFKTHLKIWSLCYPQASS